jgi:iron(III) transport system substrate-binding protein
MKHLTAVVLLVALVATVPAPGQTASSSSVADVASYKGSDRQERILEGAKREGKVVWYTTLTEYRKIADVFESKYPGIKVEAYRTSSSPLITRVLSEAEAGRHFVDVIETTSPSLRVFQEHDLLEPYYSPYLAKHPEGSKEEGPGGLVFWTTDRESFNSFGYNTNLLRKADVPKSFADLLNPALKDKMGFQGSTTGGRMIGAMLKAKGEEFVRSLKKQNIKIHMISGGALNGMIVAGEVTASPTVFRNNVLAANEKGGPVAWQPMELVVDNAGGVAIYAHAQHPNAAVLFADFLIGPQGQEILEKQFKFGSPLKDYGFKRWYPEKGMTVSQYEQAQEKWQKLLAEITLK